MTWMPANNPPMQPGNPMMNPWLQLGLGILSNNRPGSSVASAVGRGAQSAMQNMAAYQQWQEQAEYRKLQAEQMKEQIAAAKEQARKDAEMQAKMDQYFADNPDSPYASIYQFGGQEGVAKAMMEQIKAQYDQPTSFMEWTLAGKPGSYEDWLMRKASAGGTKVEINNNPFNPLQKSVVGDMQSNVISADIAVDQASRTLDLVRDNPSVMGPLPRLGEKLSALVSGAGDFFGSETVKSIGQFFRPKGEGGASATDLTNALLATKTAAREIMAPDKGPLTENEQADYKESLGMLASSDAAVVMDGLGMLIDTMNRRVTRLKQFLRTSGAGVPGELPPTREDLEFTAQRYGITVEEVQRRLLEQQLGR